MRLRPLIKNRDVVPLSEMLAWCKRQRRNAPENHPRFAAYTLLIDTLEHLSHAQDVTLLPTPRLEKLAAKARKLAGWEKTKPKQNPPESIPPGHRQCPKCRSVKLVGEFLQRATDKQRRIYGWHNKKSTRWVSNAYCKRCRTARIKRDRRKEKTRLLEQHPHYKLLRKLQQARRSTLRSLSTATDQHAQAFYTHRAAALIKVIQTVQHLLDTSPSTPIPTMSDWTQLLEENHRQTLLDLHHTLILQHLPGRSPTL